MELRLDGKVFDDRLDYVGGLYFFGETGITNDANQLLAPLQAGSVNFNTQDVDSYAAFVHGSYAVTARARVSAGIRYTRETKEWNGKYAPFSVFASGAFDPTLQTRQLVLGNGDGIPNVQNDDPTSTARVRRRETWTPITPKLGLDFQVTPDVLLFASVARGSRAGGFNGRATTPVATEPFDPEYTLSYEIGEKAEFLDDRIRLNATAFYMDYRDLQQSVLVCAARLSSGECQVDPPVFAPIVANAASARIYGGEIEVTALGWQALRVDASLGYTNAKYINVDPVATQASGLSADSVVPWVPDRTFALGADYALDLWGGSLKPRVDYTYRSGVAFNVNPGPYGAQGSVALVNATLTYARADDRWSAQLFARNLMDREYVLWINEYSHFIGGPGGWVEAADPREYGFTVTFNF